MTTQTDEIARLTRERDEAETRYCNAADDLHDLEIVANQLRAEVERLRKSVEDWHDAAVRAERNAAMSQDEALAHINEVERLRQCCTQRGARMQIMRDWMDEPRGLHTPGLWPPTEWYYFTQDRPEAEKWFDDDGVPVDATAREGE